MTRRSFYVIAFSLAVGPQLAHADTKVAVVNVAGASEKYAKTADLEAQFDAVRRKLNQERDAMKEKIEKANRSLQEELKPGTDEFRARRKQIALMEAELQWFVESEGQKVEKGLAESLRSIYDDIQTAVREIAQGKGVDIVLAADQLPAETPDSANQVRQHILLQKVLFWNPSVDLTDEVITRLNARYKASAPASGAITIESAQIKPKEPAPSPPPKKP
ncbi:MAG: OmpH family outer membrane protein [Planctomycetota bacterium]